MRTPEEFEAMWAEALRSERPSLFQVLLFEMVIATFKLVCEIKAKLDRIAP